MCMNATDNVSLSTEVRGKEKRRLGVCLDYMNMDSPCFYWIILGASTFFRPLDLSHGKSASSSA